MIGDIAINHNSVYNNRFTLHFNPNASYIQIVKSLIHELTHVKQVSKGELKPNSEWDGLVWKTDYELSVKEYNKLMKNPVKYAELPWEREAYDNMLDIKLRNKLFNSTYWLELRGKDPTLDYILDNIN